MLDDPRYLANLKKLQRQADRVIGGAPVKRGEFVDCVAVGCDTDWACSGTLIGPTVVITAGHCANAATRVFFGLDVSDADNKAKGTVVAVKKRFRHPKFKDADKRNDLTVLVLEQAVPRVDPRPLATTAQIDRATDGRVVGFGKTDPFGLFGYGIKRFVDVPVASSACSETVDGRKDHVVFGCFKALEIVAGRTAREERPDAPAGEDTCKGDSGGPFYVQDSKKQWRLAGATSRATAHKQRACGGGGIYVRLDRYRDWIEGLPGVSLT